MAENSAITITRDGIAISKATGLTSNDLVLPVADILDSQQFAFSFAN